MFWLRNQAKGPLPKMLLESEVIGSFIIWRLLMYGCSIQTQVSYRLVPS